MILVGGEALFDLVLEDGVDNLRGHPGGGPFNAARTIGRLAQPVAYLGRLSTDRFGERLQAMLVDDGVDLRCVVQTDDPTTLAVAEVDHEGVARYRFYERGTSAPGLEPEAALAVLPDDVRYAHVGTLGLALEPSATALEAVVARLADSALIAVDPNCRPWVVDDHDAYRARLRRVLGHSHVVKVSDEDLDYLEPDLPAVEGVRALLEHGPAVGLLTRGPNGARRDHPHRGGGGAGAARQGGRHDRRRRCVRRRLPRLVERARARRRRARQDRHRGRGHAVRLPGRRAHVFAAGRLAALPPRARVTFISALTGSFSTPAAENPTVAMIEAAYRHHGIDARYLNCEVQPAALGDAVRGARAMGWRASTARSRTRSR